MKTVKKGRNIVTFYGKVEKIVQTLRTVCNVVPDRDAGFATLLVTYSREYYGKKVGRTL